ncbi:NAD(P)-binding domain-containing protein [Streptomyces sp. RP5T]|uniref:NAD(P)-binding domain-containing protein n=1 Tax=Streptomyces sp. RP5T TaxID=2490848 RepID=UPI001C8B585E|nr:NAD(P)-binding domain-containing protein [Streptomyces sp. RP5T]
MTIVAIIGAGEAGSQLARTAISTGYEVVLANSRRPQTLASLIAGLGPAARAAHAAEAAAAGDFVVIAAPLTVFSGMPAEALAGKIVLDTNNYFVWRDGHIPSSIPARRRNTNCARNSSRPPRWRKPSP